MERIGDKDERIDQRDSAMWDDDIVGDDDILIDDPSIFDVRSVRVVVQVSVALALILPFIILAISFLVG